MYKDTITMEVTEYLAMLKKVEQFECLESYFIEEWDYYSDAMDDFECNTNQDNVKSIIYGTDEGVSLKADIIEIILEKFDNMKFYTMTPYVKDDIFEEFIIMIDVKCHDNKKYSMLYDGRELIELVEVSD